MADLARHIGVALLAAALAACGSMAPTYERAPAPVAPDWPVDDVAAAGAVAAADLGWSEFYADARLRELIALALAQNRDLRATALAVEAARAQYRITRAQELPTVDASAAHTAQGAGARASGTGAAFSSHQYSAGVGLSAFEIDLFGRLRSLKDQALESFLASEESLRAARISLVAEVALAYLTLAADQAQLGLAENTLASQRTSFELTRKTFEIGTVSALDVAQAQISVDTARADIAIFRTRVTQSMDALTLLVGQPLAPSLLPAQGQTLVVTSVVPPAGLPSQTLLRRPDVLAAERSLRAANANIGAARAALFPRITLTTTIGTSSASLSDLFGSGTRSWSFIPRVSLPIFDGGAARAAVQASQAQRDISLARYEQAIQVAFREVADALAQQRDISELVAARQSLVVASEKGYRLSDARYRRGVDSSLSALDAQRSLYSAQKSLIDTQLAQQASLVTLYRVLGGGWQGSSSVLP